MIKLKNIFYKFLKGTKKIDNYSKIYEKNFFVLMSKKSNKNKY